METPITQDHVPQADLSVLIGSSMSNLAILRQAGSGCCCSRFQSHDLGTLHRSAVCQIDSGQLVC
jgi:hypothetical protein